MSTVSESLGTAISPPLVVRPVFASNQGWSLVAHSDESQATEGGFINDTPESLDRQGNTKFQQNIQRSASRVIVTYKQYALVPDTAPAGWFVLKFGKLTLKLPEPGTKKLTEATQFYRDEVTKLIKGLDKSELSVRDQILFFEKMNRMLQTGIKKSLLDQGGARAEFQAAFSARKTLKEVNHELASSGQGTNQRASFSDGSPK